MNNYFGKKVDFDSNGNLQVLLTAGSDSGKLSCFPSVYHCIVDPKLKNSVLAIETPSDIPVRDEHRHLNSSQFQFQKAGKWCSLISQWMSWSSGEVQVPEDLRKYKVDKNNFDYLFVSKVFLPLWRGIKHGSRCADCFYAESLHSSIDGVMQGLTRVIPIKVDKTYTKLSKPTETGSFFKKNP
ncbi:hypothetical protein CRE_21027 [Caenorhabditis remanei]|uniref:Uncharacterized protein n=1 Tax=Caenorhabditis remanei TaxID=31234 RepID=E3NMX4_CAERE|nr:hypothetical protein CRE_21027 [Caenorhabditis remanei]